MMVEGAIHTGNMGAVGGASRTGREWEGVSRRCFEGLGGGGELINLLFTNSLIL